MPRCCIAHGALGLVLLLSSLTASITGVPSFLVPLLRGSTSKVYRRGVGAELPLYGSARDAGEQLLSCFLAQLWCHFDRDGSNELRAWQPYDALALLFNSRAEEHRRRPSDDEGEWERVERMGEEEAGSLGRSSIWRSLASSSVSRK